MYRAITRSVSPPSVLKIFFFHITCGPGSVSAPSIWRPPALLTRQNRNLCGLFTRQIFFVVADGPPSPTLKITFDASKVALLAGRTGQRQRPFNVAAPR